MVYNSYIAGERLKLLRQQKHLNQTEIANILGIAQTTYSAYETGRRDLNIETLMRLSTYYNVSADWIIGNIKDETYSDLTHYEQSQLEIFKQYLLSKRK